MPSHHHPARSVSPGRNRRTFVATAGWTGGLFEVSCRRVHRAVRLLIALTLGTAAARVSAAAPEWITKALAPAAPAAAPTTDAELLLVSDDVTYVSADRVRSRRRMVVRVLADSGKKYAEISSQYDPDCEKIVGARAWVLNKEARITYKYDTEEFADVVAKYENRVWNRRRILELDAASRVGVGDVFATEVEFESISGLFDTSHDFYFRLPVARRVLDVRPPAGMTLGWHATSDQIPPPAAGTEPGSLHWEMQGLPGRIGSMPLNFLVNPLRVSVRPAGAGTVDALSWQSLAARLNEIIEPRLEADQAVRERALALTTTTSSRWERIRAITHFAQAKVSYFSVTADRDYLAGYRPHRPEEVLRDRYGDCKDKAALVVAMLRALGERAWMVLVYSENPKALAPEWPAARFNHAIVALAADDDVPADWPVADSPGVGRVVLFDPTDSIAPLGVLPASDSAGAGLTVATSTTGLLQLPTDFKQASAAREASVTVDASGGVQVTLADRWRGSTAAEAFDEHWTRGDGDYDKWIARRVHELLPLARDLKWTDRWDAAAATYELNRQFSAAQYGRVANGTFLFVCPKVLSDRPPLPPWTIPAEGVSWIRGSMKTELARLRIPEGFVVEDLPRDVAEEAGPLTYRLRYQREGDQVVFEEHVELKPSFLDRAGYEMLGRGFSALTKRERQLITLRRKP